MKRFLIIISAVLLAACSHDSEPASDGHDAAAVSSHIPVTTKSPAALEHLRKGEVLFDNIRNSEAALEFKKALALDPGFALARAYYAQTQVGSDAVMEAGAAEIAARALPEAERVLIEGMAASVRGDSAKARESFTRVAQLMPDDSRAHFNLGQQLLSDQKYTEAEASLKTATKLNANAGGAQNMLGYVKLRKGDPEGAVAAFSEYVRIMPQEPNAQDSLGEALMAAGRFAESQAAFQKAIDLSPQFWNAHQGMAYAKFYAGDWAGGHEALAKAAAGATTIPEKMGVIEEAAIAAAAQNNTAEALRMLDTAERTDGVKPSDTAFIPLRRATVLIAAGRARDALAPLFAALTMADGGQAGPVRSRSLRRQTLRARIAAEVQLGNVAAADRTAAALDDDAAARRDDPQAQSAMHYGRGLLAILMGDAAGAKTHFAQCSGEDVWCKAERVAAADRGQDTADAGAARDRLLRIYERDSDYLLIRSQLVSMHGSRQRTDFIRQGQ